MIKRSRPERLIIRCVCCGVKATRTLATGSMPPLCDNVVCTQASIDLIKQALLEQAQGEL